MTNPTFQTTGQAARRLGVSSKTVTRWCESGRILGAIRTEGGHWRVPASYVERVEAKS